jgi:hypothetical protein
MHSYLYDCNHQGIDKYIEGTGSKLEARLLRTTLRLPVAATMKDFANKSTRKN